MAVLENIKRIVSHYYGDTVRVMFFSAAVVYAVSMPLFGHLLPIGIFGGILLVLFLVLLAGFTNPHLKVLMVVNVLVSAVGVYLLQTAAIEYLRSESAVLFILRQASVILFLIAFYDGIKTLRAMFLGTMGHEPSRTEFDRK